MNLYKDINIGFTKMEKDGIVYYTVPSFKPYVDFAFCGDNKGKLHFKATRGADCEDVKGSYRALCNAMDLDYFKCVMTNIVHGDTILLVDDNNWGMGVDRDVKLPPCDALITKVKGMPIATTHADCMPIAYFDPDKNVGCVIHAGWRGILAQIHKKALETLIKQFDCRVCDILVAIGPTIGKCCFEVDKDLSRDFEKEFDRDDFITRGRDKDKLDLTFIAIKTMVDFGIMPQHITIDGRCTACEGGEFTSYRRDKDKAGTMAQIMSIR